MTRKKPDSLVKEFLEKVSGSLLEDQYRPVIAKMIRGHAGIYALYKGDRLYYVGLATNLMSRVKQHLIDRHTKRWDKFSVYLANDDDHIKALESLLLRVVDPSGNRVTGRLPGAIDRKRQLNKEMTNADSTRRAELLGGNIKRNKVRRLTTASKGSLVLAGLVSRRVQLQAEYKGHRYRASLLKSGHISYANQKYDSPTAAAKIVVGRPVNGWSFWKYKNGTKGWVELSQLRK